MADNAVYDDRLAALKAHQQSLETEPHWRDEPPENGDISKMLLGLAIAQGIDFLSTERPLGFMSMNKPGWGWEWEEGNPLPGMKSHGVAGTGARVGYGILEMLAAKYLMDKHPKVGKALSAGAIGVHTGLARGNWDKMEEARRVFPDVYVR